MSEIGCLPLKETIFFPEDSEHLSDFNTLLTSALASISDTENMVVPPSHWETHRRTYGRSAFCSLKMYPGTLQS